jgi:hypothetical protein
VLWDTHGLPFPPSPAQLGTRAACALPRTTSGQAVDHLHRHHITALPAIQLAVHLSVRA